MDETKGGTRVEKLAARAIFERSLNEDGTVKVYARVDGQVSERNPDRRIQCSWSCRRQ